MLVHPNFTPYDQRSAGLVPVRIPRASHVSALRPVAGGCSRALIGPVRSRGLGASWADVGILLGNRSRDGSEDCFAKSENPTDISQKWFLHCLMDIACGQGTKFQTVPTYSLGDISEYVTQY